MPASCCKTCIITGGCPLASPQVPLGRWDVDGLPYPGAARFGGWLGCGIECFDAALFGMPAQEAVLMDVQHRCAER